MKLFPVVLQVASEVQCLKGRQKVSLLSKHARQALRLSADRTGVAPHELLKDQDDVPLPSGNYYWSVSHKAKYVAAVISTDRTGIDIEEIKPRSQSIFSYVAGDEEWQLCGGKSLDCLYRYWTAKEAVVKAAGTGLAGMRACRVVSVPDESQMLLFYQDSLRTVEQLRFNGHIVAVLRDDNDIEWTFPAGSSGPMVPDSLASPGRQRC
jgi:4'-phosphopantetheinyl transferase